MSAFTVSKLHIDVLVHALGSRELVVRDPSEIGQVLWDENYASVNDRYSESDRAPRYRYLKPTPARLEETWSSAPMVARQTRGGLALAPGLTDTVVLKSVHCYDYQSCEHLGWAASQAKQWVDLLEKALLENGAQATGAEYSAAPWTWY